MTRRWRLGAFGLVIAVVAAVAASPASAAPPVHEKPTHAVKIPERYRKQIPLIQAADVVRAEIERGDYSGYAGIELEDDQVAVWWKGAVPEPVSRAIDRARSTAPVRVGAASHSLRELRAAGASIQAALAAEQPRIKYAVDGSRVVVGVHDRAGASRPIPRVGVPVEVVDQGQKDLTSRRDDWAPWSGGATMVTGGAGCTIGFPVTNGTSRFLLTAGHCGNPVNPVYDGTGEFIGYFLVKNAQLDLALVLPPNGVDPTIYIGGVDSNAVVHVDGWDYAYPGEYLCQSGVTTAAAIGGILCDLQVERFNTNGFGAVEAQQIDGQVATRPGDSGGPVFTWSANGGAIAVGITSYASCSAICDILGFEPFSIAASNFRIWIAQ